MPDKFKALWVSHSSISDFQKCPRSYFLKNIFKDPSTKNKMKIISPPLALGSVIHNVLEGLSTLPSNNRFTTPLMRTFEEEWESYTGEKGGFRNDEEEREYKKRGEKMIMNVIENPGPLGRLAVKINMDLPFFWLSEEDNIILCGKIDWLEYLEDSDSVNIIDFKTSKSSKEDVDSLQLPIYHLLVDNCQSRAVQKALYWYLDGESSVEEKDLPDLEESHKTLLNMAKKIKVARQLDRLECPAGEEGCYACRPFERILKGEGKKIGTDPYRVDMYVMPDDKDVELEDREGIIL